MQLWDLCSSVSSLSLDMKLQTALIASSICDVLTTHSCLCYCRPARHPCLKDSFCLRKVFPESVWSHPIGAKGQKLAVQLEPVEVNGTARERAVLGRSSANHLNKLHFLYHCFLKISFVTVVLKHWRCRISALLFPCTNTSYCLVAHQMVSPWADFMLLFLKQQQLLSAAHNENLPDLLEIFQKNTYWMRDTFNLYWITSISK